MSSEIIPYNARHTAPRQIAESFIIPRNFFQIARNENTLLVGPRGSGKTTILKALTPSGLYHLHQRSDLIGKLDDLSVQYLPIYIPAETSWKGDAQAIRQAISDSGARDAILNGLFVDHALHWLVLTIEEARRYFERYEEKHAPAWTIHIDDHSEERLSRLMSDLWRLEKIQTSFLGLKLALIDRSNIYRSAITNASASTLECAMRLPSLDILQMFRGVIEIVHELRPDLKWSFNFDEMEIAPRHVVSMLYENLRSWDQRAVLKFSLFPYVDFYSLEEKMRSSVKGPVEGQDYQAFQLTNEFQKKDSEFAQKLVEAECARRDLSVFELARYLNSSKAIHPGTRKSDGIKSTRIFEAVFQRPFEQKTDPALIEHISKKGYKTAKDFTSAQGENTRARMIRKIAPIVEFRNYYLSEERSKRKGKSRRGSPKGFGYYHGYNQIVDLTECNPRAIKYYINDLLDALQKGEDAGVAQNRVIGRNVDRFRALIASQSVPDESDASAMENSLRLADKIASMIVPEVLSEKFKTEPRLTVEFKNLDEQTKRTVEVAINAGALIVDQSRNNAMLIYDVEDQRLRLSHSFAPYFPLPLITGGNPIIVSSLNNIETYPADQSDLFGWAD